MEKKYVDADLVFQFAKEQRVKETGAFSKGLNKGLSIIGSAVRNRDAIPAADVAPIQRWISVKERLPEHQGWFLAVGPIINTEVMHYGGRNNSVWSSERYYNMEVTYWMPLPELPLEDYVHA